MIGQVVTFDGHRLNDSFYVGNVEVGLPSFEAVLEERGCGDGSVFRGTRLGTVSISVPLIAKTNAGLRAEDALSDLMAWLDVDGPRQLQLSQDRGRWRYAVPSGAPQISDYDYNDALTVQFTQPDPALYGVTETVYVPSGGSVTVNVGGDYPTSPTVETYVAVRDGTTRQWGLRMEDGTLLHVPIPVASQSSVIIDCGARTCLVNGAVTIPTLTSDWLTLTPGRHTLRNDLGAGDCKVSWTERWHR